MKLIQRIGYYLGGFSIGLVLLTFFLTGKKTSCSYGPESRVIKNINSKKVVFSDELTDLVDNKIIDSLMIRRVLKHGDLNFSKSEPRKEPCAIYYIEGYNETNSINLTVKNCDSIATVLSANKSK